MSLTVGNKSGDIFHPTLSMTASDSMFGGTQVLVSKITEAYRDLSFMVDTAKYSESARLGLLDYFNFVDENGIVLSQHQLKCRAVLDGLSDTVGRKRAVHAFRRLREKGLCPSTYKELMDNISSLVDDKVSIGPTIRGILHLEYENQMNGAFPDSYKIPEQEWFIAMELTMLMCEPSAWMDTGRMYVDRLIKHLGELYCTLFFALSLRSALTTVYYYQGFEEQLQTIKDGLKDAQEVIQNSSGMEAALSELKEQRERERQKFDIEKRRYEKRILRLEHDVAALSQGEALREDETDDDFEVLETVDSDEVFEDGEPLTDSVSECLPGDDILFVGGHPNMVKKLKSLHPFWTYQSGRGRMYVPKSTKVVFVWTKHLGHPEFQAIQAALKLLPDVPMVYVSATNMSRLEQEMSSLYSDYLNHKLK